MDTNRNKIISSNIKKYIKENNITQKELANKVGISPSTMSDYMNLRSNPSHGVIQKIADYFGILKSDIDTTYKELNGISNIYSQLNEERQTKVYNYASRQLEEQNSNVTSIDNQKKNVKTKPEEKMTVAAHIDDGATEDELKEIYKYIEQKIKEVKDGKYD